MNDSSPNQKLIVIHDRFRTLATWLATLAFGSAVVLLLVLLQVEWRFEAIPDRIYAIVALVELFLSALLGIAVRLRLDLAATNPNISHLLTPLESLFARVALGKAGEPRVLAKTLEFQTYALILGLGVAIAYVLFSLLHIGRLTLAILGFTVGSAIISLGGFGLLRNWLWRNMMQNSASSSDR
ncbi:MAG: hypothetical protein AAFY11_01470 [Cyanobacteria bacterium J06641_5]